MFFVLAFFPSARGFGDTPFALCSLVLAVFFKKCFSKKEQVAAEALKKEALVAASQLCSSRQNHYFGNTARGNQNWTGTPVSENSEQYTYLGNGPERVELGHGHVTFEPKESKRDKENK